MTFDIRPTKRNDTATFKFRRLSPDPQNPITLTTRQMGTTNPVYVDAVFGRGSALVGLKGAQAIDADRDEDIADLARYCVTEWSVRRNNEPVPCMPDEVIAFLKFAVANGYQDEVDELRAFAKTLANFREPMAEASAVGKK